MLWDKSNVKSFENEVDRVIFNPSCTGSTDYIFNAKIEKVHLPSNDTKFTYLHFAQCNLFRC